MKRQSIEATYDSRDTGYRFHVTTEVGDRTIAFRQPVPDPFVRTTVRVGLWDALRSLARRRHVEVTVLVGGDVDVMNDVVELDYNTLVPGSTRRDDWNSHVRDSLAMLVQPQVEPKHRPWLTDDGTREFVNGKPIGYCSNCVERCEGQHGPCYDEVIGCTEDFKPDGVGGTDG